MGVVNWSASKLQLFGVVWLNVGGQPTPYLLDVSFAEWTRALNTVPTATVNLAAGRDVVTGLAANVHYLIDQMRMQLPFQLYVRALETANSYGVPVEPWPAGPFLVFEGYTAGTGFTKNVGGQVGYSLSLVGWPVDLNFSSCLTRTTHALNPAQLSNAASFFGGFGAAPSFVTNTLGDDFFTVPKIQADFWGQALGPWLLQLCEQDVLTDPDDPVLQDPDGRVNFEATRALARFEPFAQNGYVYGVPLGIDPLAITNVDQAVQAIADDVASETFASMGSQTLWDKLVGRDGYGGSYLFAVVPMTRTALVVPFQPGLRGPGGNVWQVIYNEEYDSIATSGDTPRALRGVRVFGGVGDQFGAFGLQQGEAADPYNVGGAFDNPDLTDGMLQYVNAPRWLAGVTDPNVYGVGALAPGGVVGNALAPGAGVPFLDKRPGDVRALARPLLNRFAQSVYVNAVTQGRQGTISGRLRFDVGAGSLVLVRTSEERFVTLQLGAQAANGFYAQVQAVTHRLDAERPAASTSFLLGWIRSPLEQTLEGTSTDGHPLWATPWLGCPDVEGFDPQPNVLGWGQ